MSGKALGFVFEHSPYAGNARAIHLALADVANDLHGNELWLTRRTLAAKSMCSERTISTVLAQMVTDGWLVELEQGGGRGKATRYRLVLDLDEKRCNSCTIDESDTEQLSTSNVATPARETLQHSASTHTQSRSSTPRERNGRESSAVDVVASTRAQLDLVEAFDAWWARYPRKVAKPAARKSFAKAIKNGATVDELHAGLTRWLPYWAAKGETDFIPHPATWLNQERWNDEVTVPENRNRQASLDVLDQWGGGQS